MMMGGIFYIIRKPLKNQIKYNNNNIIQQQPYTTTTNAVKYVPGGLAPLAGASLYL